MADAPGLIRSTSRWFATLTTLVALSATQSFAAEEVDEVGGANGFFFIHVSDVHAYRHASQVAEHYGLGPAWTPRPVLAFFALRRYARALVPNYSDGIVPPMRAALGIDPKPGRFDLWDGWTYFNELLRPGSERYRRCVAATYQTNRAQSQDAANAATAAVAAGVIGGAVLGAAASRPYGYRCGYYGCW